ncbi:MAG: YdaS family helix-turn-helix protein [Pseudomonadota bacterium]
MTLAEYLSLPGVVAARFAAQIGAIPANVSQWRTGLRPVPIERCVPIEVATEGRVRRWDLRPTDWGAIWPELIGAEGAPAWPVAAVSVDASTPAFG